MQAIGCRSCSAMMALFVRRRGLRFHPHFMSSLSTDNFDVYAAADSSPEQGSRRRQLTRIEQLSLQNDPKTDKEIKEFLHGECKKREVFMNNKVQNNPWRMALIIHRFDTGARDRDDIDQDFRHGVKPIQHDVHHYIHANIDPDVEHPFSKKRQKAAVEEIIQIRHKNFVHELLDALKSRKIQPPLPADEIKEELAELELDRTHHIVEQALGILTTRFAQALQVGEGQQPKKRTDWEYTPAKRSNDKPYMEKGGRRKKGLGTIPNGRKQIGKKKKK